MAFTAYSMSDCIWAQYEAPGSVTPYPGFINATVTGDSERAPLVTAPRLQTAFALNDTAGAMQEHAGRVDEHGKALSEGLRHVANHMNAPRKVIRDAEGNATGVEHDRSRDAADLPAALAGLGKGRSIKRGAQGIEGAE